MVFCPISDRIDNESGLNYFITHHENIKKEIAVEAYIANDINNNKVIVFSR